MRCLTLASALRERRAECWFFCRDHVGNLISQVESRGFIGIRLPAPTKNFQSTDPVRHSAWLGADWQSDVEQVQDSIKKCGVDFDWIIVDHYGIDHKWE